MERGAGAFSEEQFREACAELQRPALSGAGWELLVETQGMSVYRLLDQEEPEGRRTTVNLVLERVQESGPTHYVGDVGRLLFHFKTSASSFAKSFIGKREQLVKTPVLELQTGLYAHKVFGVLEDCLPDLLADVYMDLAYRKQWDQYVKELYEKECNGETVVYWQVKYPFPMSNRDYVYVRQRRELDFEGQKVHVIVSHSTSEPQIPEKSGVIRVKQYTQRLAIQSDGKRGSKVFMYYFDNPGGQIPSWVINWAAKNGVPNFLKDMVKACQNYRRT